MSDFWKTTALILLTVVLSLTVVVTLQLFGLVRGRQATHGEVDAGGGGFVAALSTLGGGVGSIVALGGGVGASLAGSASGEDTDDHGQSQDQSQKFELFHCFIPLSCFLQVPIYWVLCIDIL